ncbi:MAG: sensor domain-containing diguanylate cyclase [Candidatus Omnitrophica bacterium]|nr:sensor domain-containing diguanylate cyclase [Candidatus Omnitrophota bacterium]MDD5027728.1 sensor domain-containing diguanylate cyclase [Candidatus Omnitrophota bacterium]MDD5662466.1 sensor domain-containing diguanylate cyclase [Candidatus Omnitrophota bacterium]
MANPSLRKSILLRVTAYVILFLFLYFIFPLKLAKFIGPHNLKYLFLFYLANIIIACYILRKNSAANYSLDSRAQEVQERFNLLSVEYSKEHKNNISLKEKYRRYSSLKSILEEINKSLDLDAVADAFVSEAFSLIANNQGVCVLYLVDNQTQKLVLFKAKREDPDLVIKAKEGNIFDLWVLRHTSPLLVEDIKNDFRFDPEKLKLQDARSVSSLIAAPFISENKFLGIIRLDNTAKYFFSQDDLRFLVSVSDLGAVALENSELFKRTQDLAIHDALTSLYTKGYFAERLKGECKRCTRQKMPLSLLMLDIDLFKNYNDKFGHTAGDIVLKKVSQIITDFLNNLNPIISRFGGEEFCAIIAGLDKESALGVAETLRRRIAEEKIVLRREESHITVSIGVATFPADATEEDELIQRADKAMYKAKQKGRNRVCYI